MVIQINPPHKVKLFFFCMCPPPYAIPSGITTSITTTLTCECPNLSYGCSKFWTSLFPRAALQHPKVRVRVEVRVEVRMRVQVRVQVRVHLRVKVRVQVRLQVRAQVRVRVKIQDRF